MGVPWAGADPDFVVEAQTIENAASPLWVQVPLKSTTSTVEVAFKLSNVSWSTMPRMRIVDKNAAWMSPESIMAESVCAATTDWQVLNLDVNPGVGQDPVLAVLGKW